MSVHSIAIQQAKALQTLSPAGFPRARNTAAWRFTTAAHAPAGERRWLNRPQGRRKRSANRSVVCRTPPENQSRPSRISAAPFPECPKSPLSSPPRSSSTLRRMPESAAVVSAPVVQRWPATRESARHIQQAAQGTGEVGAGVVDVQRGAAETGSASAQLLSSARLLSRDSTRLIDEVAHFVRTVRA